MRSFKHYNATSIEDAVSLMKIHQGKARLLSGGTDLLSVLKDEILPDYPEALINIKTIPGLDSINEDSRGLKIGAMTKIVDVVRSPLVRERYKVLSEAAKAIATPEIRNMGTVGGNLCQDVRCWYYRYPHQMGGRILCYRKGGGACHAVKGDNRYNAIMGGKVCFAVCPSDTATALTALDARLKVVGTAGERIISINDFYGVLGSVLNPDEIMTELQIPRPPENTRQTFIKFRLREPVDFAVVSVASIFSMDDGVCKEARIALGAVAPTPVRATSAEEAIQGEVPDASLAEGAAEAAVTGAKPMSMNAYKIEITKTLVKRAILS